jgi:tetratricopeptide (TPR) repeat protein
MVHMPSHIDVRRGRWEQAILANNRAIETDRKYREISPRQGFYAVYMSHNHDMLSYASMMTGQRTTAVKAMDDMVAAMPPEFVNQFAPVVDGFMAMPLETRMRFGMWDEILAAPELAEHFPIARTLRHYARGVAFAARGRTAEARAEQKAFVDAKANIPADAAFGNNSAAALLAVAEHLLDGEILYREGKMKAAVDSLRVATQTEDTLHYDEPPDWIQPTRHALGAALLQSRRWKEAETVFREDLRRLPENGWGLYGLARSLRHQGKGQEASEVEARFAKVWEKADTKISSPCFCQPGI